jgi:hypothetical protein
VSDDFKFNNVRQLQRSLKSQEGDSFESKSSGITIDKNKVKGENIISCFVREEVDCKREEASDISGKFDYRRTTLEEAT